MEPMRSYRALYKNKEFEQRKTVLSQWDVEENKRLMSIWKNICNIKSEQPDISPEERLNNLLNGNMTTGIRDNGLDDLLSKKIDLTPIKDKITPLVENGFIPIHHVTFHGSSNIGHEISTSFQEDCIKEDISPLFNLINGDLQFNINGRLFYLIYTNPYYSSRGLGWARTCQYFAFNPLDKNNPDLSDIWVDVYK